MSCGTRERPGMKRLSYGSRKHVESASSIPPLLFKQCTVACDIIHAHPLIFAGSFLIRDCPDTDFDSGFMECLHCLLSNRGIPQEDGIDLRFFSLRAMKESVLRAERSIHTNSVRNKVCAIIWCMIRVLPVLRSSLTFNENIIQSLLFFIQYRILSAGM